MFKRMILMLSVLLLLASCANLQEEVGDAPNASDATTTTSSVTTPAVTTPAATTPAVTTPAVTTPAVTTPAMTTSAATTPAATTSASPQPDPEPLPNPPGSLIDPDSIPKADQSDVGKTVELSIGDKIFDYFYDSQSGKERLLVLESVDFYQNLGKITIYETKLGGMDGLIAALKKPFNAKILAISNISWEEVNYAHTAKEYLEDSIPIGRFSAEELIDLSAPVKNPRADQWYCSVQSLDSSDVMGLLSNLTDAPSKVLQTRMNRIDSILTRFDLKKYL